MNAPLEHRQTPKRSLRSHAARAYVKARRGVRRRGWLGVAALVRSKFVNYAFDRWYGIETRAEVGRGDLKGTVGEITEAEPYQASEVMDMRKLFRTLGLGRDRVLVDLGSGKGRVLLVAAAFGFRAARGIEFSSELCDIARRNVERFLRRSRTRTEFEVIHADAGAYAIRPDEDVFFLANSFHEPVLRRVMQNISTSFQTHPRHIMLIYRNPMRAAVITDDTPFVRTATHVIWRSDFAIFEARP